MSDTVGLLVSLDANPGRQQELSQILDAGLVAAAREPGTLSWYSFRVSGTEFGIYSTFRSADDRRAHVDGPVSESLRNAPAGLLRVAAEFAPIDVLAVT